MKIKEYKNKIVLAELEPDTDYICLANFAMVDPEEFKNLRLRGNTRIYLIGVTDIDKSIRFVKVPKKL